MEYSRGLGVQGKELQLLIELVEDKMIGAPRVSGLPESSCIPESARCGPDGSSSIPGFRAIMIRAINNAVAQVENRIKLALYPRRKTNFAKEPREVYEDRVKFSSGTLNSFVIPGMSQYPTWNDLNQEQQDMYQGDSNLYTDGTFPWDLLTPQQRQYFSGGVIYVPNKSEDEEKLDGRERSYIKLYERNIIKIYALRFELLDPMGMGMPYLHRSFDPNEYYIYNKEGAIRLFPAQAKISAIGTGSMISYAGYGLRVPSFSQILRVDYSYGLQEIPPAIQEAVALLAAAKAFELINIALTKGMMSYSVQGFSASFGEGLYRPLIARFREEAEELLANYYMPVMTAW